MPDPSMTWPAVLSAAASAASAATAFVVLLIHRQNARDAVRPELVLEQFGDLELLNDSSGYALIPIRRVRNIGKGPAFNLRVTAKGTNRAGAEAHLGLRTYEDLLLLEAGAAEDVNWTVRLKVHVPPVHLGYSFDVNIYYVDVRGRLYLCTYDLRAFARFGSLRIPPAPEVARNVSIGSRSTRTAKSKYRWQSRRFRITARFRRFWEPARNYIIQRIPTRASQVLQEFRDRVLQQRPLK